MAKKVGEATALQEFADWLSELLRRIGCGGQRVERMVSGEKAQWSHTQGSVKMLHLHHLASFCQANYGAYTFNAISKAEGGVAHRYQSQPLVICLAAGHSPSFSILASMMTGVLPTGKVEGRQQLRGERAMVANPCSPRPTAQAGRHSRGGGSRRVGGAGVRRVNGPVTW